MTKTPKPKQLLKILIGAAWLDGVIQPEERAYLRQLAQTYHLDTDPEIAALLAELKVVMAEDCYAWVNDYLGDYPSEGDYGDLLETLSGLLYSDGDIQTQEARLLAALQDSDPGHPHSPLDRFLARVQRLYRHAIHAPS